MRKNIFIALIGILAGIGLFINFETINPLLIMLIGFVSALIFTLIDKKLSIFALTFVLGFFLSSQNLDTVSYTHLTLPTKA